MLSQEEKVWLIANENKYSTAMKKFILFMSRIQHRSPTYFATYADVVERDMKNYRQEIVFGDHPQPEGKE